MEITQTIHTVDAILPWEMGIMKITKKADYYKKKQPTQLI
jgi:hypothetical protein